MAHLPVHRWEHPTDGIPWEHAPAAAGRARLRACTVPFVLLFLGIPGGAVDAPTGMVFIPAGQFAMGSNQAETNNSERPVHQVRLSAFWMDRTEVTNA